MLSNAFFNKRAFVAEVKGNLDLWFASKINPVKADLFINDM